jgi:hypothetical protein
MDKKTVSEEKQTVIEQTSSEENVEISPRTGKPIEKKYSPKTKKKPRGGNNWLKPENMLDVEDGDNTKFLMVQMELLNMPEIDMKDEEAVQNRLNEYFALYARNDMKPTVAGMGIALNGMSRQTVRAIAKDLATGSSGYKTALPSGVSTLIKKAYFLLENLWESYMNSGKVNPVAGIFLGKNNYGYQDKTEYVLTPNTNQDNDYNADEIRERYIAADQQKRLEQGSDDSED